MKSRILTCATAMTLFVALAAPVRRRTNQLQRSRTRRARRHGRLSQRHQRARLDHRHRQPAWKLDNGRYSLGERINRPSGQPRGAKQRRGLARQE